MQVTVTWRSRTEFIIVLKDAPIYLSSKKQLDIETSTFRDEFIAMKQCAEYVRGLRYKLRMMGIPCEGFTFIYGNNQSECACSYSTLKKKLNIFVYKFVREGCARNELRTTYASTHQNAADLHHCLQ